MSRIGEVLVLVLLDQKQEVEPREVAVGGNNRVVVVLMVIDANLGKPLRRPVNMEGLCHLLPRPLLFSVAHTFARLLAHPLAIRLYAVLALVSVG